MVFSFAKKLVKKAVGTVKKVVKGVAKGVKKAVKGVAKVVREVGRGVKKLTKNKYIRMGLMIAAAVTLPMFVPAIAALPAVAAGAVTGAITGGAGALLQGGDLKDVLKGAAFGSATGAAFAKVGEAIKSARASKEALEGAMTGDVFGGELAASGERIAIGSDAVSTALDAAPTISLDSLPRDSLGQIDLTKINVDVAPQGALRNITSSAFDTPLYADELGRTFTSDLAGNMKLSGVNLTSPPSIDFATLPKLNSTGGLDFANVTGRTAPVGGVRNIAASAFDTPKYVDSLGTEFSADELLSGGKPFPTMGEQVAQGLENVNLEFPKAPTVAKPTLGEKIRSGFDRAGERLKEAFTPENVVDKTLEVGENLLVSAAQGALAQKMQGDPEYVGDPAYAQQEYANQLQQFQIAYQNAGININDAYANMTYGSGDINAMGNELFRQDTIRIV